MFDGKVSGGAFAVGIKMHRQSIGPPTAYRIHEAPRPIGIIAVGTTGDQKGFGFTEGANVSGVAPVMASIFLGLHIAAAAPVFVPDSPVANVEGLRGTVGTTLARQAAT